jgi:uncharacterized protein YbjT (DUF2867 family)
MTILITGARGSIARSIIERLHAAGTPVRAASKSPGELRVPEGVPTTALNLSRPDLAGPAFDGVSAVFLYPQPEGIDDLLKAASSAGVERIVLLSSAWVLAPGAEQAPVARPNVLVERAITGSGITSTFLRPDAFATNARSWIGFIRDNEPVPLAYPDAHVAAIHPDDIADIAAAALAGDGLAGDGLAGHAVTLTGPESLTFRDQLATIAQTIGRGIGVRTISRAEAERHMGAHVPAPIVANLLDVWAAATAGPAPIGDTTQTLLGRPARTFAQWAAEYRDAFAPAP